MPSPFYVLHVKPRTENKVLRYLEVYGTFRYLPTYVKERRVQRRKIRTVLPLFPGYVFCRLNPENRLKIMKTNLLVRLIEIPYPRETIHQLRQIAHAGRLAPLTPRVSFHPGEEVRVKAGPFYGLTGRIDQVTSELILEVDILGRAVSVAINPDDCERV